MKKPIFLLLLLCLNALVLSAQSEALDREIASIVSDLATKMATKTAIKNVAIADFTKLDGSPTELGKYLAEQFSDVMVNANTTFSIVDRGRLNYLLKEAGLDAKGLLDPNSVAKLGKLKGIDAIVIGTMTSVGENLNVNVKALNLETAVILASAKGSLRRTPSIIALEEKGLSSEGGGQTATTTTPVKSKTPVMPAQRTFQKAPLLFECLECTQSGQNINCKFRITSVGRDAVLDTGARGSGIIDEEGNDFFISNSRLANVSGGDWQRKTLVADVPISAEFTFSNITRTVSIISKMDLHCIETSLKDFTVSLRNIPVIQK